MVHTMTGHLVAFLHDAQHHLLGVFGKVSCTEEGCFDTVFLQHVENAMSSLYTDLHTFFHRNVYVLLARYVELLRVKTQ